MREVGAFMAFNAIWYDKVLAQMVKTTWLCETWVRVLYMPIICYFNMCIYLRLYLNVSSDNVILKL